MSKNNYIDWLNQRAMRGRNFFTKRDLREAFPDVSDKALSVTLNRLTEGKRIMSPWQNFYVIIPTQYKLKSVVPPSYYIDDLMAFLGRRYYVSLLSAAALHGASHQAVMSFFVTADGAPLHNGIKNGSRFLLFQKKDINIRWVKQIRTEGGYMNVSSPLMTILDIVKNESKIGGISRASEIIYELTEKVAFDENSLDLLKEYSPAVMQRLGYILGFLELEAYESDLLNLCKKMGLKFRYTKLKYSKTIHEDDERNKTWKIIVNETIDLDEI